jgi:hypothetical protein
MDAITETVLEYLKLNTNNALLITGDYGIGKTYFFKTNISPEIAKTSILSDASKNFKPVHISLFGIKSVEDLQTQIYLSLFPFLKSKTVKLTSGLAKSIARGVFNIIKLGDIDDYIDDVKSTTNDVLSYEDLVLCFDDLDRKSDNFSLIEILGFINSIVENENAKVIIIANENKLDQQYKDILKEKVVGVTVHFIPNIGDVYDEIISKRYQDTFELYFDFLNSNRALTLRALGIAKNNLRTLIFFTEYFKIIYSSYNKKLQEIRDYNSQIENEKLTNVLLFTFSICIEYKNGNISYLNKHNLDNPFSTLSLSDIRFKNAKSSKDNSDLSEQEVSDYRNQFLAKYYPDAHTYHFYSSVFNYITGGNTFNIDQLREELSKAYFNIENLQLPQNIVLQKLLYTNYFYLDTKEYKKQTYAMLKYVDEGIYPLNTYTVVFHFATRFNNLLQFDIQSLLKRFKKGIKKVVNHFEYDKDFETSYIYRNDTEWSGNLLEIYEFCASINKKLSYKITTQTSYGLLILLSDNLDEFILKTEDRQSDLVLQPLFSSLEITKVLRIINSYDSLNLYKFTQYLMRRYKETFIINYFNPDKEFFEELVANLSIASKKRKIKNLRNHHLDSLLKTAESILQIYNDN